MADWVSLFASFGYPALVSGVLLYIIVNKFEKTTDGIEKLNINTEKLIIAISELRNDLRKGV